MASTSKQQTSILSELPVDRLKDEVLELGKAMAQRGLSKLGDSVGGASGKVSDIADAAGSPAKMAKSALKVASPIGGVKDAASKVKDALPGTGSDGGDDATDKARKADPTGDDVSLKVTNIVETIDVPVSREVAYRLWTQFEQFPAFMKKVENVKQKKPEEVTWKAQVFWSHRTWKAKILDQSPPEHIVWKSEGEKGHVDGAVTFHELAPDLTRILVSLEYHPQGLFERTGNLWRAQGRRVRLELRHFRRHVANHALLHQDELEGWEGEISDGKVKRRRSSTAKKSTAKKSTAKKSTAKKSTSSASGGGSSSGSTTRKSTAKKSTPRKSTAKKSTARKSTTKKSTSGSTSKRTAAASKRSSTTSARTSPNRGSTAKKSSTSRARKRS